MIPSEKERTKKKTYGKKKKVRKSFRHDLIDVGSNNLISTLIYGEMTCPNIGQKA
jgi:hypothetical protein